MGDAREIYTLLPEVHRARDCRLYDRRGNRYLDLWRNGGRALLGHRPDLVYKELKKVLQKGVVAEYPSRYTERLKKALRGMIPGNWEIRLFASRERALAASRELLHRRKGEGRWEEENTPQGEARFPPLAVVEPFRGTDPELSARELNRGVFYRPFFPFPYHKFPLVLPLLPFPGTFAPQPLLIGEAFEKEELPPDDPISPVLAATLTRTVFYLMRLSKAAPPRWEEWELPGWSRISCYLIPRFDLSQYRRIFASFLERKILIPPTPEDPLLLPMEWSRGEKALVECTARELLGEGGTYERG